MRDSLEQVPGVHQVTIDFDNAEAHVTYDPGQLTSTAPLVAAVEAAGYKAVGPEAQVKSAIEPALDSTVWAVTSRPRPHVTAIVPCHSTADVFRFTGPPKALTFHRSLPEPPSGVPHTPAHEAGQGRWTKSTLRLKGAFVPRQMGNPGPVPPSSSTPVTYELRVDPATGNLVGTRNGQPVRLAPADLSYQSPCGAPPP